MRKTAISVLAATAVTLLAGDASAARMPQPLEGLVGGSGAIVVGVVAEVRLVEGVRVARLEVHQILKGQVGDDLWYLAESRWPCDSSQAMEGERAILFLHPYEHVPAATRPPAPPTVVRRMPGTRDRSPSPDPPPAETPPGNPIPISLAHEPIRFKEEIQRLTGDRPLWAISHWGSGRMPVLRRPDGEFARVDTDHVELPDPVEPDVAEGQEAFPHGGPPSPAMVPLEPLLEAVHGLAAAQVKE